MAEPAAEGPEPHGFCTERFLAVRERFADLLSSGEETGASVSVVVDGETVVDLWGGWCDAGRTQPWQRDTLVATYSVTKVPAALTLLWALGAHSVDLDEPVAAVWPEYGCEGKENTRIRQVLAHQAGLPTFPPGLAQEAWADWGQLSAALARARPAWPPGTAHAEHAWTYGHLVGEIARRIDGRSVGRIWREELAQPLSLDFWIGLPEREESRVAELEYASPEWAAQMAGDPGSLRERALTSPAGGLDLAVLNSSLWRRSEIPAVNGHGTATAVARLYAALTGQVEGLPLSPDLRAELLRPQLTSYDLLLERDVSWGLGVQFEEAYVGMGGIGGSDGLAQTELGYAFGYVTRRLWNHDRAIALSDTVEGVLRG